VPPQVWQLAEVQAAARQWDLGTVSRHIRQYGALSQEDLARLTGLSQGYVSMLESGARRLSGAETVRRFIHGLGMPIQFLAAEPDTEGEGTVHASSDRVLWTGSSTLAALGHALESDHMQRRSLLLLTGAALANAITSGSSPVPELAPALRGGRIDQSTTRRLAAGVDHLRLLDAEIGGGSLVAIAKPQLALIINLIKKSRYDQPTGRLLWRTAADLAGLLGWFLVDDAQHATAQTYFLASLRAAHTADDPLISVATLSYMAVQSYSAADPRDAATLAQTARDRLHGNPIPLVEAMLAIRAARGLARHGDAAACAAALHTAARQLSKPPTDADPGWLYWMSEGELHAQTGSCLLDLGQHRRAVTHFQQAIDAFGPPCVRDQAQCLTRMATAQLALGNADQACADATRAVGLAQGLHSTRFRDQLRGFHTALVAQAPRRMADEFTERAGHLLTRVSPPNRPSR
jgi:transcriptional regulator with XRE-family HTH domain/tetratricopeptide (TPR) repeat protein